MLSKQRVEDTASPRRAGAAGLKSVIRYFPEEIDVVFNPVESAAKAFFAIGVTVGGSSVFQRNAERTILFIWEDAEHRAVGGRCACDTVPIMAVNHAKDRLANCLASSFLRCLELADKLNCQRKTHH